MTGEKPGRNRRRALIGVAAVAAAAGGTIAVANAAGGDGGSAPPRHEGSSENGRHTGAIGVAAAYIGLDRAALRRELASGRTLAQVAAAHGKSIGGLISLVLAAERRRLDAAVASGQITQARAQARLTILEQRTRERSESVGAYGGGARRAGIRGLIVAAHYLGRTPADLRAELRSGHTLAQIADATPGRSAAGLATALLAARRERLDLARQAGRISAKREQQMLAKAQTRIPKILEHKQSK